MRPSDWLWLASLAFGALNAWQNVSIKNEILQLHLTLGDRIAKSEADVRVLQALAAAKEV